MTATRLPLRPTQRCEPGGVAVIQSSAPVPSPAPTEKTRRALEISAANRKTILNQKLHPPPYTGPIPELGSDLNSDSDSCSDSNFDSYSDPDTEPDTDIEPDSCTDPDLGLDLESDEESDADLDSEAEEILKDIAQLRKEGPAKPNHTPQTKKLWKREGEIWET